jgi:hypothetical protein
MPAEKTTTREVREVLRLKVVGGLPTREIVRRIGVAVRATLNRFGAAGLSWPLPEEMTELAQHSAHVINSHSDIPVPRARASDVAPHRFHRRPIGCSFPQLLRHAPAN